MFRRNSFYAFAYLIALLYSVNSYAGPLPNKLIPETKITSIKAGNAILTESGQKNFTVNQGEQISIYYQTIGAASDVFYRIYLDGIMLESKYVENVYRLTGVNIGGHIFKIVPYTADLTEGVAAAFSFTVKELESAKSENKQPIENDFRFRDKIVYVLSGVILVQLILLVIVLIRKRTAKPANTSEPGDKKNYAYELNEAKRSHKKVLDELKRQTEENEYLRQQINELNNDIKSLEDANIRLVEQKERLSESKHKLELLQSQKEELFAIAIHDIKNPASAIRGYIELLNSYDLNATEQHDIMTSLVETSDSIVQMSQSMCTLIAKTMPEPKYKMVPSSVVRIIDDVCIQNGSYAKSKKVKLENKGLTTLPDTRMDPDKIEEALDNLVNNAIKYAPPDTSVEVKSFIRDGNKKYVAVEVKDTGVGLSEEDLKKSFQKGVMLTPKPTGLEQSSGLGLWIVKKIIEEHGGRVYVNSKEGVGSTFGFELPVE